MAEEDIESKIAGLITRVEKGETPPVKPAPVAEPKADDSIFGDGVVKDTSVEPPAADDAGKPPELDADGQPKKRPGGYVRKIQKLSEANTGLEGKVAQLEAELTRLKAPAAAAPASAVPVPASPVADGLIPFPKPKPSFEQFDSLDAYTEAMADWKLDSREWDQSQKARLAEYKEGQKKTDTFINNKFAEGFEKYGKEDFDGASNDVGTILQQKTGSVVGAQLINYIMQQDNFSDLTWALANDEKALAAVIATGNPDDARLELRSLSRQLKKQSQESGIKQKESKPILTPNRIQPPSGGASVGQSDLAQLNNLFEKAQKTHLEEDRIAYFVFKDKLKSKAG